MRRVSMFQLQELVRLHRMGAGCREVARLLGISPNTERDYRDVLTAAGLLTGAPTELPSEEDLQAAVRAQKGTGCRAPQASSVAQWLDDIAAWSEQGAQPQAIYERLKRQYSDFTGSHSAVKRACRALKKKRGVRPEDVAIPVVTLPGQIAQVDFGYVGRLIDPKTKGKRKAWVFVMTLGHSRYSYYEICFDQKIDTWLQLHVRAFEWFGGVPEVVVPDNLKAAVVLAAFTPDDTVGLNRSYRELARHYGYKIDPTPPYAPKKKGKVESGVKYVKGHFFKVHADEQDAHVLQSLLMDWALTTAAQRIHGTTHKRPMDVFVAEERGALRPLPPVAFDSTVWKNVKVHQDSHVMFDKTLYSVPWRFVGERGWVRATKTCVQVFIGEVRVATHRIGHPGKRVTEEAHLPEGRRDLRHRSRSYWLERAELIGPHTLHFVGEVFDADDVLDQLRKVQAIVMHLEKFPVHRAEAASQRASFFANYEYRAIKRILLDGLDAQPLPVIDHVGSAMNQPTMRYARDIQQMIEHHLYQHREENHEPN